MLMSEQVGICYVPVKCTYEENTIKGCKKTNPI